MKEIGDLNWWTANEAHNGYLELYLNLGLIGLLLMLGWIYVAFQKSRSELVANFELGRFHLAFLVPVLLYNWTESGFRRLHPVYFVFCIIALGFSRSQLAVVEPPAESADVESMELAGFET